MKAKESAATVAVVIALGATPILGKAIVDTRTADCQRTQAVVRGLHSILERSSKRAEQYVKAGVITEKQAQASRRENRRNVRAITLPKC